MPGSFGTSDKDNGAFASTKATDKVGVFDTSVPPSDIVIETLVMGHEVLGDPKQVKKTIQDAVQKVADEVSAAEGVPPDAIPRVALDLITTGLFEVVNSPFGLTDQVRGSPMSKTIKYADWFTLPAQDSKRIGPHPLQLGNRYYDGRRCVV
jgi:hypothetical protein